LRPYQLMEIVARVGAGASDDFGSERLSAIVREMRQTPYTPIRLRANVSSIYAFQNPGHDEDTPGGVALNVKRDLDILQKLGMTPGTTMPAIDLFDLLFSAIPTAAGITGYDGGEDAWAPCEGCSADDYAAGVAEGLGGVFYLRDAEEMVRVKQDSAAAIYEADHLYIRPHHVMCMTCFYGSHLDNLEPIEEDNLYEVIIAMQRNPEIPVTLIEGPCMVCPPCAFYDPAVNMCYLHIGIGLRDEKKDLDVLKLLGLHYGDTLPAREYLRLLYEHVPSTRLVCGQGDGVERAPSWRICDKPEGSERYAKGRRAGLGIVEVD
ncbi:MAG: hypothetical protein ACYC5O_04230, partial [Anaerolineae bacterium]